MNEKIISALVNTTLKYNPLTDLEEETYKRNSKNWVEAVDYLCISQNKPWSEVNKHVLLL